MEMDDDDEFGGLYTDILRPAAALPSPARPPCVPIAGGDRIPLRNPSSNFGALAPAQTLAPSLIQEPNDDWLPDNWNDDEEEDDGLGGLPVAGLPEVIEKPRVPVEGFEIGGDVDQEPVIPGLSSAPIPMPNGIAADVGNPRISNSEDWDSDSEDDLQIVLNDSSHHQHAMMMEDDEDGEEDLVIVTDGDQQLLHHQSTEQDWGEGEMAVAPPAEGEKREGMDLAKANGPLAPGVGPRVGYSGHPFQPQHHSMYKYIRPGGAAAAPVVGSVGPPGQIRPPPPFGSVAGRGRGDWRPPGIRGISNTQKSFHSGMPPWANSSSGRGFGGGLDFTLPSHRTIFEVEIESFEEKPWRHPGVDISDYFNFGLDEDNWKDYCKQLDQHRVASTMQSKIRVYESGRSDQDFDPDLPPELAAAAGHHDISADNLQYGKIDNGQVDLSAQGRGIPFIRPPLPTGRPIQVETGSGERLPSIDTRPPRTRDADAIIEIVLQDSMGDSAKYNGAQAEKDIQGEPLKRDHGIEERHGDREYVDGFSQKEMNQRRIPSASEGDGILPFPSELPLQYHRNSKTRSPINAGGSLSTRHEGRLRQGTSHGRCSSTSGDNSNDAIGSRRAQVNKHDNHQKERLGDSVGGNQTPEKSPAIAMGTAREPRIEQTDDRLALGESVDVEGEESSDFRISGETLGNDNIIHSRKQKLISQVEPIIQDNDDDKDFRATHSDSSRAKSGSSKEYRKQRDDGEEVVQDGRMRRASDMRKHQEEEHTIQRKDDYGRQSRHEMDKIRMSSKGREAMHHSYPYREWESNSAHLARGRSVGFEKPRESDNLFRQRRDDDIHRRVKDDDIRRDRIEETGSRNRSKIRLGDRNDKEDDIHTKRRVDDVDWRGRHREGGQHQRERDDVLMNRRENLDDQVKRKKDDHSRREKIDKEDTLPAYRAREDSCNRKRERDDVADRRRREETNRIRDKPDDHHSSKKKDESWRQREREDRQRLKPPHEDSSTYHEREGVGAAKSRAVMEDKPLGGNVRSKTDSKGIGSDKDYLHREKRRQPELSKKGDLEDNNPLHKVRDDVHVREKRYNTEERGSKHERLSTHNNRSTSASDNQHISRERAREGTRKSKDTEGSGQNPQVGKRKHEGHVSQRNERVSSKGTNERENINAAVSKKGPQLVLSSEIHADDIASDDENQQDAKRGRSKLERWTSHKEREYIAPNMQAPPSSIAEEVEDTDNDVTAVGESPKIEGNAGDPDAKGGEEGQITEKLGDDRHLDTVAKLKKRSERFKLPMPGDKDPTVSKKPENEFQPTQTEGAVDTEVKPERPARKRRWTSS